MSNNIEVTDTNVGKIEENIKQVENFLDDFKNEKGEYEEWHRYTTISELHSISNVVNELKRIRSLDINKLVEDYETGQLIDKDKIRELINNNGFEVYTRDYGNIDYEDKLERRITMDSDDKAICIITISIMLGLLLAVVVPIKIRTNYYKQKYEAQYEHELKMKQIEVYGEEVKK